MKRFTMKTLKFFFGAAGGLALVGVIMFNLAVVWVATEPRSLTQYIPTIVEKINTAQSDYRVEIGDGKLLWDGWKRPFDVRLYDVKLFASSSGVLFAQFPEISATANLPALMMGKVLPDSVILEKPSLVVERQVDGTLSLGFGGEQAAPISTPEDRISSPNEVVADVGLQALFASLHRVEMRGASVTATDVGSARTVHFFAPQIALKRNSSYVSGEAVLNITEGDHTSVANLRGRMALASLAAEVEANLQQVNLSPLAPFVPQVKELASANVPVSGAIEFRVDGQGQPTSASVDIVAGEGSIAHDVLEQAIPVHSAALKARLVEKTLYVDRAQLQSGAKKFEAKGKVWQTNEGIGLSLDGVGKHLPIDDVRMFWPKELAPLSREWIVENLSHGISDQATLKARFQPGDFAKERFPNEAILAVIPFRDGHVKYKPQHEKVTDAAGVVTVNANQLFVDVNSASGLQGTKMSNGKVTIDDLIVDNPRIEVAFDVSAPMADVARFLAYPDLNHAAHVGLDAEAVKGSVSGRVNVGFDYFAPKDAQGNVIEEEAVDLEVRGKAVDVAVPNLLKKFEVSGVTGDVFLTTKELQFTGKGSVFGSMLEAVDLTYDFTGKREDEMAINAKGVMSDASLSKLGVELDGMVKGKFGVDATLAQKGDVFHLKATTDMTPATLNVEQLNWTKPVGEAANFSLTLEERGGMVDINQFRLKTGEVEMTGKASVDAKAKKLTRIAADNVTLGRNHFSVDYAPIDGGSKISLNGAALDLQAMLEREGEGTSFKTFPALDLNANLDKVYLANGVIARDVKAKALCSVLRCTSAQASAVVGEGKKVSLAIASGAKRSFDVRAEDAGEFLRGLDVFKDMVGGKLAIEAAYEDKKPSAPLTGMLTILDYRVKGAGVLAKLLTLASFSGIVDTLQGNEGIKFDKLKGNFVLKDDVISVENLRSVGDSLGLVMDGKVDVYKQTIDMKGTVVPSYTINSMFKDVPIIGEILTGGEGIIAAVFTISGKTADPEVSVNPLSILAPGFLRKMFE